MISRDCFMDMRENWIGQHRTLGVLPNGFPIGPLHLLLVPGQHREDLRPTDLESALDFARVHPHYLIFQNTRGAGASRPQHLHFQALLRDGNLPIEAVPRRQIFALDGVSVGRVEDYPVYGLAIQGEGAAEIALAILGELQPVPHNLVINKAEIVVVPRTTERPSGFTSTFGGLEMAGCVVLTEEARYRNLEYDELWQALAECGLSPGQAEAFEASLHHSLLRAEVIQRTTEEQRQRVLQLA